MKRHDWIADVLTDLHDYSRLNGLHEMSQQLAQLLVTARKLRVDRSETDILKFPKPKIHQ